MTVCMIQLASSLLAVVASCTWGFMALNMHDCTLSVDTWPFFVRCMHNRENIRCV